jgi:hypothetical protein
VKLEPSGVPTGEMSELSVVPTFVTLESSLFPTVMMSESSLEPTVVESEPPFIVSSMPSSSPSVLLSVETTLFTTMIASGDTYIYKNGFVPSEPAGNEETMLVQNGPEGNLDIPDTYALVSFTFGPEISIQSFARSTTRSTQQDFQATLCLQHMISDSPDALTTTYSLCRVDVSSSAQDILDVDSLNGAVVSYSMPDDCVGKETFVVDFDVVPEDTEICIDILGTLEQPLASSRQNRKLTPEDSETEFVLFMIDNLSTEQKIGDRFYTRNSGARSPKIIIVPSTPGPTGTPQTMGTFMPTLDVTSLSSQSEEKDSNRNGLYSLFLLLLLIPVVWFAMKKRSKGQMQNHIDGNTMPSQVEYYLTDQEVGETGFADEGHNNYGVEEADRDQQSIYPSMATGSVLEGQFAYSDGDSSRDESSGQDTSDSDDSKASNENSTVDWEEDHNKLIY